jgi:hypothetical protein
MVIQHNHGQGVFDAGHCRACAREAGVMNHYWRLQREEDALRAAQRWPGRPAASPSGRCARPASASPPAVIALLADGTAGWR